MISPVSSNTTVQAIATSTPKPQSTPPVAKPTEDTVKLSPQAQAAAKSSGDVDHDGDSH